MSEVDWKIEPAASSSWRRIAALTRLPLWPTAIGPAVALDEVGLRVGGHGVARGRVADVADRPVARAASRGGPRLNTSFTRPMPFSSRSLLPSPPGDARRLLAAVLQGVEPHVGEVRRLRVADDAEQAALVVEVVVLRGAGGEGAAARAPPDGSHREW